MLCAYEGWTVTKPTAVITSQCKLKHDTAHLKLEQCHVSVTSQQNQKEKQKEPGDPWDFLVVQWLRHRASTAGGTGSIPGWEIKIHVLRGVPKNRLKKKERENPSARLPPTTLTKAQGSGGQSIQARIG